MVHQTRHKRLRCGTHLLRAQFIEQFERLVEFSSLESAYTRLLRGQLPASVPAALQALIGDTRYHFCALLTFSFQWSTNLSPSMAHCLSLRSVLHMPPIEPALIVNVDEDGRAVFFQTCCC